MRKLLFILLFFAAKIVAAQNITLEGYIYESKNRGYLNQVKVMVLDSKSGIVKAETETNNAGFFSVEVPGDAEYRIGATKEMFLPKDMTTFAKAGEKTFAKLEMDRKPGYLMDITLAEKRIADLAPTDGLTGVRFEVYNNTTGQEVYHNDSTSSTNLQFHMEQGNHYTYLVRKKGFFSKRIEAYVNVKGCILCIDGIDKVNPGVVDNLTSGLKEGVLLANLELQPMRLGSSIQIKNIYYDLGSAALRPESRTELDKLAALLKENPYINVELGSHTDARGDSLSNMNLSQRRAESVTDYLVRYGKIDGARLTAKGYGERKLINRCADGVVCTEPEHQENRRTELKILSSDDNRLMEKTLVEIIRGDNMEKTLQQIQTSDVIEVKEGEAIPDDLKQYIESQKKGNTQKAKTETPKVEPKKKINESVAVVETEEVVKTEVVTKVIEKPVAKTEAKVKTTVKTKTEKVKIDSVETPKEAFTVKPTEKITTTISKENIAKPTSKIIAEKTVKTSVSTKKIQTLAVDYSGYMVEILTNPKALGGSNEVFTRFDSLTLETTKNGIVYYAGSFQKLLDVENFYISEVKTRYPNAKIVRFVKGKKQ